MRRIDLNADLGESFGAWPMGDDAGVLRAVSSANVAAGFHAGDPLGIRRTCELAVARGVRIGAHPGYRDLAGFGRRAIAYAADELEAEVIYQVGAVAALAASVHGAVRYVKPHGALYAAIAHDEAQALAVVRACSRTGFPLMTQPGSVVEEIAHAEGVEVIREGFADRAYRSDGRLVSRGVPGAVLSPERALEQAVSIAVRGEVTTIDGEPLALAVDSLCLHGDSPGAVSLAARIRDVLLEAGVSIGSGERLIAADERR